MGRIVEHDDGEPAKLKKKSKKDKNMTNDTLPSGDDHGGVETDSGNFKKKTEHKHEDKKNKSEPKEVVDEDQHDKGILVSDDLQKKNKSKKRKSEATDVDEDQHDEDISVNDDLQKKNKKKKRKHSSEEAQIEEDKQERNTGSVVENDCDPKPGKKIKKKKTEGQNLEAETSKIVKVKSKVRNKTSAAVENDTEKFKLKSKKVSFSGHVEVFPISGTQPENETTSDTQPENETTKGDGLLRGKRFTPEEDEIVKQAVLDYIAAKGLGDDGLDMVLNCRSHKGMKKCWQEIGVCIPYRPSSAIYYRAHILFERGENRSWSQEEIETLKEFQKKYGNDWKKIAEVLGRHRFHVKDTWRRIKLENLKAGKWNQDEYQKIYDLVNLDLLLKVNGQEKRKSKYGMLRDNIPWTAISEKLTTRSDATCCMKWYNQLTSSLVAEKKWADADDYRMIGALYEIDAACIEDVDWENLLEHRDGEICLKRWKEMVRYIGDYASKSFGEQVDIVAKRYCPDAAATREVFDNMPVEM